MSDTERVVLTLGVNSLRYRVGETVWFRRMAWTVAEFEPAKRLVLTALAVR